MRTAKFTTTFTLALSESLYDTIKNQSDEEGISMAELIREVLDDRFEQQNSKTTKSGTRSDSSPQK